MNTVVYQHLIPNNEVFYIGIGSKKRPKSKSDRSNYWHNIVNKYGYKIEILHENLNWELACEIEIHLISYYGRKDLGLGPLVNLTDGGDGSIGVLRSKESIEKQKITYYNRTLKEKLGTSLKISKALKNRIISQETKDKLSKVKRGNKNCLGRVYTEAQKTQLSISNKHKKHIHTEIGLQNVKKNQFKKGHSIHNKKVINTNTGEIFESAKICHLQENLKISAGHLREMMLL